MNCGKNVRLKPIKRITAASFPIDSGYILPVILGHQKCKPAITALTIPPTIT